MSLVDEGHLLLASIDRAVCELDRRVLRVLHRWPDSAQLTLDGLAARVSPDRGTRPLVFAAVARLENRGWIPHGVIR